MAETGVDSQVRIQPLLPFPRLRSRNAEWSFLGYGFPAPDWIVLREPQFFVQFLVLIWIA
jgi:hypothetical protein